MYFKINAVLVITVLNALRVKISLFVVYIKTNFLYNILILPQFVYSHVPRNFCCRPVYIQSPQYNNSFENFRKLFCAHEDLFSVYSSNSTSICLLKCTLKFQLQTCVEYL